MKITGVITAVLPETSGTSQTGKLWRKKEAIVEYQHGYYPKSIVFQLKGENIDKIYLEQGKSYELEIDFETREWQGRYFLSASCWKATEKASVDPSIPVEPAQLPTEYVPQWVAAVLSGAQPKKRQPDEEKASDDLPF